MQIIIVYKRCLVSQEIIFSYISSKIFFDKFIKRGKVLDNYSMYDEVQFRLNYLSIDSQRILSLGYTIKERQYIRHSLKTRGDSFAIKLHFELFNIYDNLKNTLYENSNSV